MWRKWQNTKPVKGSKINFGHPLSKGLVGAWLMNEGAGTKALDLSGNRNTGILSGTAVSWTVGDDGSVVNLPGTNERIAIANSSITQPPHITVIVKSRRQEALAGTQILTDYGREAEGTAYQIRADGGVFQFRLATAGGSNTITVDDDTYWPLNVWAVHAMTWNGTILRAYLDGVQIGTSSSFAGDMTTSSLDLGIGARPEGGLAVDCAISYYMIYDRALSASEMAQLYREPFAMFDREDLVMSSPTNLLTGLVSYWKLDDNLSTSVVLDAHGSNNGTVVNDQTNYSSEQSTATAKIVRAFDLDGTNDYVDLSGYDLISGDQITVSAWIKADVIPPTGTVSFVTSTHLQWENEFELTVSWEFPGFMVWNTSGGSAKAGWTGSPTLQTGTWYHLVGTYNGSQVKLYLNGSQSGDVPNLTGDIQNNYNVVAIGAKSPTWNPGGFFDGTIDEVGIWNRALTPDEITELYNSGNGLAYPFTDVPLVKEKDYIVNYNDGFITILYPRLL